MPLRARIRSALQRLTVTSFALSADTAKPNDRRSVPRLPSRCTCARTCRPSRRIELPSLAALEVLGDERKVASSPGERRTARPSRWSRMLRNDSHRARDARRDRRARRQAKRYSTNDLTLEITGRARPHRRPQRVRARCKIFDGAVVSLMIWIFGIVVPTVTALVLVAWLVTRPRAAPPPPHVVAVSEPHAPRSARRAWRRARGHVDAAPSRVTAARVRDAARQRRGRGEKDSARGSRPARFPHAAAPRRAPHRRRARRRSPTTRICRRTRLAAHRAERYTA